jgi:Flp pilus assembly secretin CpaC
MASVVNVGRWRKVCGVIGLCLVLVPAAFVSRSAADDTVMITLDQARVLRIPERTSTVVVGNPLIADISVQTGGMIVVTGKGYGVTNLIALDQRGTMLMEQLIEVRGPTSHVVVVYRGIDRESYSCTPYCERRITLGDTPAYFDATLQQSGRRDSQAMGAGAGNEPRR